MNQPGLAASFIRGGHGMWKGQGPGWWEEAEQRSVISTALLAGCLPKGLPLYLPPRWLLRVHKTSLRQSGQDQALESGIRGSEGNRGDLPVITFSLVIFVNPQIIYPQWGRYYLRFLNTKWKLREFR